MINGRWVENQVFFLLKFDPHDTFCNVVGNMVEHIKQYMTCDHIKDIYLDKIKGTAVLYDSVLLNEISFFCPLSDMQTDVSWDMSLNSYICDEDIQLAINSIYGHGHEITSISLNYKHFFFEDGDSSSFSTGIHVLCIVVVCSVLYLRLTFE